MKRIALSMLLLSMTWGPDVLAQGRAYKCILPNSCQAPPCEFVTELKAAKATVRAYAKIAAPDSASPAALAQFKSQMIDDVTKRSKEYSSKCPTWTTPRETGIVSPSAPSCEIGLKDASGNVKPATVDDFKSARVTCSEIVEADFRRLEARQDHCLAEVKSGRPFTVARVRANGLLEVQSKVDSLRDSLSHYLNSCAPDANLARELSRLGLDSLMKDGKAARDEWQARRASGGAIAGAR